MQNSQDNGKAFFPWVRWRQNLWLRWLLCTFYESWCKVPPLCSLCETGLCMLSVVSLDVKKGRHCLKSIPWFWTWCWVAKCIVNEQGAQTQCLRLPNLCSLFIVISSDVQQIFSTSALVMTLLWGPCQHKLCFTYDAFNNISWKGAKSRPVLGTKELPYSIIISCSIIPFL